MSQSNLLTTAIQGVYSEFADTKTPASLTVAPVLKATARGEFFRFKDPAGLDLRDPDFVEVGYATAPMPGQDDLEVIQTNLKIYRGRNLVVPTRFADEITETSGYNYIQGLIRRELTAFYDLYSEKFVEATAGLDAATGALNVSAPSAALQDWLQDNVRKIQLASRHTPTHFIVSPDTAHAMQKLNEVQGGSAVAAVAGGETVHRLGYATFDMLRAFIRANAGVELVVDDRVIIGTNGTAGYALAGKGALVAVGGGYEDSAMKTLYKPMNSSDSPITIDHPNAIVAINGPSPCYTPMGFQFYLDSEFQVKVMDGRLGVKVDITV